jgi:MFS family permease
MALLSFLDREHSIAEPGFSRWLIPPAAWAVNLSIGQVYAFSVFKVPLTRLIGVTHSAPGDWAQTSIAWIFSLAIGVLGISAAVFGRWIDREGPRKAMFYAAVFFALGFFVAALGIRAHHLWLLYLGYGVVGGIGLGLGYITPVAVLLKWFPDRPGFATGLAMVGFGGGAMVGSPLSLKLMAHFQTATDTGMLRTFLVMGAAYFVFMIVGTFLVRLPRPGWKPEGWTAASETDRGSRGPSLISAHSVSACDAVTTPQFWLLWIVICANATAGFGILEQASPMIQDLFAIGPVAASGFVGVLSLFNMAGRFFWSSVSDSVGRKLTFLIFLAAEALLYWILPFTGSAHLGSVAAFVIVSGVLISMYGGGFSTIPAYLKDLLGPAETGAIYGRLQTATSTAGILGPILVNYSRQHELSLGVSKAGAYEIVLDIMAGFLVVGFVANLLVRPVASKFWIRGRLAEPPLGAVAAAD